VWRGRTKARIQLQDALVTCALVCRRLQWTSGKSKGDHRESIHPLLYVYVHVVHVAVVSAEDFEEFEEHLAHIIVMCEWRTTE